MTDGHSKARGGGECPAHGSVSEQLRALAELLAERLEPGSGRPGQGHGAEPAPSCAWCPVCSILDLLRGQRPELAARLTEHGAGLLAAVREALTTPAAAGQRSEPDPPPGDAGERAERVQHVPVRRTGGHHRHRQADT